MPEPFLAILSQSLSEAACSSSSQVFHALRETNGTIGRSGLAVTATPFDGRCPEEPRVYREVWSAPRGIHAAATLLPVGSGHF
jgi:hypothetical protein